MAQGAVKSKSKPAAPSKKYFLPGPLDHFPLSCLPTHHVHILTVLQASRETQTLRNTSHQTEKDVSHYAAPNHEEEHCRPERGNGAHAGAEGGAFGDVEGWEER